MNSIEVDGVLLPAGETHMVEHMTKNRVLVDGVGTYQHKKLEAAVRRVPSNKRRVAIDVGAHVGLWSMHLSKLFDQVHAFEPLPVLGALWDANMARGGIRSKATLHRVALGDERRTVDFQMPVQTTGNSHVAIAGAHPGTRGVANPNLVDVVPGIEMRRLDEFGLQVDFLKIDVEGFEKRVLLGGEKTIRRHMPVMIIEQKGNDAAYGDPPRAALRLLERWGARVEQEIGGDFIMSFCKPCGAGRAIFDKVTGRL